MKKRYIPKKIKEKIRNKFEGRCVYCGEKPLKLCVDHMIPFAYMDGSNDESNLMPACFQCNSLKIVYDVEQFRNELQLQVDRARKYSVNFRFAEKYGQIQVAETPIKFYFESFK